MICRIAAFAVAAWVFARPAGAQDPVTWTAKAKAAAPGAQTAVTLSAALEEGWHIYSVTQGPGGPIPTRIAVAPAQPFALAGKITGTAPHVKFDENFGINVETYETKAQFTVPVQVAKTAKAGAQKIDVNVRYQACNASSCLPPRTEKVSVAMTVGAGGGGKASPSSKGKGL